MTEAQLKAKAAVTLLLDATAPAHEQIGELEHMAGIEGTPEEIVECFRCSLKHTRKQWEANHRSCPFCGRTTL